MKRLLGLLMLFALVLTSCDLKTEVKTSRVDKVEKTLKPDNLMVHTAYFWFKEDVTPSQIEAFKKDSESLRKIDEVEALYYGTPSATDRSVVEKSYDFAIVVHFKDLAAHDVYQEHEIHQNFLKAHASIWEKVMVTDIDPH